MNHILIVLLIVLSLSSVSCVQGVDLSQLYSTATYQCLRNNGFEFAIPRGYCSFGGMDPNIIQNLQNGKSAGLITDFYMFPCRGKSGTAQVD
jgi:hypothetical protein